MDDALTVEVLACTLRMEKSQSSDLMEHLASMLSKALPDETKVDRGGFFLSANRPVVQLTVTLPDGGFQLVREKNRIIARQLKIVRNVVLKTEELSMEAWIMGLAAALSRHAEHNSAALIALEKFVE